jgi:hypothetical protein
MILRAAAVTLGLALLGSTVSAIWQDGASHARLLLNVKQFSRYDQIALQIQIKERRTKEATDVIYQVLWPNERKGEAVLLRVPANRPPTGAHFMPPDKLRPLCSSQMNEFLFGSGLSYEDVIENFYAWEHQARALHSG